MDFVDYYKILELDKNATDADIKKAYRKLARKYHPDVNPNDETAKKTFQRINEANEVLSNPESRQKYDKYGKDWKQADEIEKRGGQQRNPFEGFSGGGGSQNFSEDDFSDFFSSMFGQGDRKKGKTKFRGQDLNTELSLELKDVYTTTKQTITINGKSIRLTIPAGVENGQTIKISGHGGAGVNGGPNGDLYITFTIANHTKFKRDGNNLYSTINLDLYTAVLGGEIMVDTFDGKVKLKVAPETQNETKIKLKGKGFPVYKKEGEFGDLYITYHVKVPTKLTDKEKELFVELSKLQNRGN